MQSFSCAREPLAKTSRPHRASSPIRGSVAGASLLCFAIDPTYHCMYFLLGKERANSQWLVGSGRWSDFGGGVADPGETAEVTAAREFAEETLAVVRYFPGDSVPRMGYDDIVNDLQQRRYTLRLTQGDHQRKFVVFVKQIPWDPAAVDRFRAYRLALTGPPGAASAEALDVAGHPALRGQRVRKEYLEKKMLSLWSVPQLRNAVNHRGVMTHRGGYVEHCKDGFRDTMELVLSELGFILPELMNE